MTIVGFGLSLYKGPGAGWIPAAQIKESTTETITPIDDRARPFSTEEEANDAALAMAIDWIAAFRSTQKPDSY